MSTDEVTSTGQEGEVTLRSLPVTAKACAFFAVAIAAWWGYLLVQVFKVPHVSTIERFGMFLLSCAAFGPVLVMTILSGLPKLIVFDKVAGSVRIKQGISGLKGEWQTVLMSETRGISYITYAGKDSNGHSVSLVLANQKKPIAMPGGSGRTAIIKDMARDLSAKTELPYIGGP
jgi:hypothetical protein